MKAFLVDTFQNSQHIILGGKYIQIRVDFQSQFVCNWGVSQHAGLFLLKLRPFKKVEMVDHSNTGVAEVGYIGKIFEYLWNSVAGSTDWLLKYLEQEAQGSHSYSFFLSLSSPCLSPSLHPSIYLSTVKTYDKWLQLLIGESISFHKG